MTITHIQGWSDNIGAEVGKTPLQVYARVPLVYRCANLVANSASITPLYLRYQGADVGWIYRTPLKRLFKRVVKDLQLYGRSFVQKRLDRRGNVENLRRLNPHGMVVKLINVDDNGDPVFEYTHRLSVQTHAKTITYNHDEIIYIRYEPESNDIEPDVYPALVALGSGKVLNYLAVFGERYFENGAMPTTVLSVMDGASTTQIASFEAWVKRRMTGIKRAFGIIALHSEVKATQLNPPAKDLAIPELDELNRKRILDSFGVPEGMVEKSSNYASAESHHRQFWDMTVQPVSDLVVDAFNEQLFAGTEYSLHALYQELPVYQVDESRRSAALANIVNAGVSIEAAWYTLGYAELPDDIPLIGRVADEPSAIIDTDPSMITDGVTDDTDNTTDVVKGVATVPSMFTHLDQWKTKAHNRIRKNKGLDFNFESQLIPVSLKAAIASMLKEVDPSHDEIDFIFDGAVDLHHTHSWKTY